VNPVDASPSCIVRDLMATLGNHPGWGIGITTVQSAYILVFADRLMVTGSAFEACNDLTAVIRAGQASLLP
jgi:hypothetical protein